MKIVADKYVIADVDEASGSYDLEELIQDEMLAAKSPYYNSIVCYDTLHPVVIILATVEKQDEKFVALTAYFEKRTVGTARKELRHDRFVLAMPNQPTPYNSLDRVVKDNYNKLTIKSQNHDLVFVFKPDENKIRSVFVYKTVTGN